MTTATVCFERKSNICIAKFGNLGANWVKESKFLVENVIFGNADPDLPIHCNCYGATMMIKGSLLLLLSIFRRKKSSFGQNLTVLGDKWGLNIKFVL